MDNRVCIIGAASVSAFPLFSGFISKSIIITEAARHGYTVAGFAFFFPPVCFTKQVSRFLSAFFA